MVFMLGAGICFKILLLYCECKCIFVVIVEVRGFVVDCNTPWGFVLMQQWKVQMFDSKIIRATMFCKFIVENAK